MKKLVPLAIALALSLSVISPALAAVPGKAEVKAGPAALVEPGGMPAVLELGQTFGSHVSSYASSKEYDKTNGAMKGIVLFDTTLIP